MIHQLTVVWIHSHRIKRVINDLEHVLAPNNCSGVPLQFRTGQIHASQFGIDFKCGKAGAMLHFHSNIHICFRDLDRICYFPVLLEQMPCVMILIRILAFCGLRL